MGGRVVQWALSPPRPGRPRHRIRPHGALPRLQRKPQLPSRSHRATTLRKASFSLVSFTRRRANEVHSAPTQQPAPAAARVSLWHRPRPSYVHVSILVDLPLMSTQYEYSSTRYSSGRARRRWARNPSSPAPQRRRRPTRATASQRGSRTLPVFPLLITAMNF